MMITKETGCGASLGMPRKGCWRREMRVRKQVCYEKVYLYVYVLIIFIYSFTYGVFQERGDTGNYLLKRRV